MMQKLTYLPCIDAGAFYQYGGGRSLFFGKLDARKSSECSCACCTGPWKDHYDGFYPSNPKRLKRKLLPKHHLLCPPRILGFALKQKMWMQMLVDCIQGLPNEGNSLAFESLVFLRQTKNLLRGLVENTLELKSRKIPLPMSSLARAVG